MSTWISLKENAPTKKEGFVLGCDWYVGDKEEDLRMAICELPTFDSYWCGIEDGKAMHVFNSICPAIGLGHNAHWMEIPSDGWVEFKEETYPHIDAHEILIKLKNGNCYVGFINLQVFFACWCPSFNTFRHGSIDDIAFWRELPKAPQFIPKPPLTDEEQMIQKNFIESIRRQNY